MIRLLGYLNGAATVLILAALSVLEFWSGKRAGVNHHLLARKHQWAQGLLNTGNLHLLDMVSVSLLAALLLLLAVVLRKQGEMRQHGTGAVPAILGAIVLICMTLATYHVPAVNQLRVSSYGTLSLAGLSLSQAIVAVGLFLRKDQ